MQLTVNGRTHEVDDRHQRTPLLWVLRDVLGIRGVKFGCGAGFCAACTVLQDGRAVKSCQTLAGKAVGAQLETIEGATGPVVDAVRDAWYRGNVVQCGYCQPGQILAASAYLAKQPEPTDAGIDAAMAGNLCRCGTYPRIRAAIHRAAATLRGGRSVAPLPVAPPVVDDRGSRPDPDGISPYLRIDPDGSILVRCSQIEMGQGAFTTLATIVAEELDADLASIRVIHGVNAANDVTYNNPLLGNLLQATGNSTSTGVYWQRYRQVAAGERARLVSAAAQHWSVPAEEIEIRDSVVSHPSGRSAHFSELAAAAAALPMPPQVQPKTADRYRLIGQDSVLRVDTPGKIAGNAQYTIDVAWPGLLTAVVVHPPRFGATVKTVDDRAARARPGVVAVITISRGVAVVAETFFDAVAAAHVLVVEWDDSHAEARGSEELRAAHRALVESGEGALIAHNVGDIAAGLASAARRIEAIYELPYLAHAPMEPDNAACRMREDGVLEAWGGFQAPDYARASASAAAGLPGDHIDVRVLFAGGAFGLRSAGDPAALVEAVEIARALEWRYPIKVQWPREEEFKSGRFRPMSALRLRGGLDAAGQLVALEHRLVVQSVLADMPKVRDVLIRDGVDMMSVEGASETPYRVPNHRVELINFASGVPVLTWRGVGATQNEFAREAFLDELASEAGVDPLQFRRPLLGDDARALAVLDRIADKSGWRQPLPPNKARGFAMSSAYHSYSAQVVEIARDDKGRLWVDRVVFVLDCGRLISPDLVRAQIEGGLLFGLSAAVWGQVTIRNGAVATGNFDAYPLARMRDTPDIEVHLIDSEQPPGGVGEVPVITIAPAIVNAIAALTGQRVRRLPITQTVPWTGVDRSAAPVIPVPSPAPRSTGQPVMPTPIRITATENGPNKVEGDIEYFDHDGRQITLPAGDAVYLCRCGASSNKPFCDGSHVAIDFDGALAP